MRSGISITVILKLLGFCETTREVKTALIHNNVMVNGRVVKDNKFMVGLMDVLSVPDKKLYYRVTLDEKGMLDVIPIDSKEAVLLPCKVESVNLVKGGALQYHCHNGYNLRMEKKGCKPRETLILNVDTGKVEKHLPLEAGCAILLTGGGLAGKLGTFVRSEGKFGIVNVDDKEHLTSLKYVFVIGSKVPAVKIR